MTVGEAEKTYAAGLKVGKQEGMFAEQKRIKDLIKERLECSECKKYSDLIHCLNNLLEDINA